MEHYSKEAMHTETNHLDQAVELPKMEDLQLCGMDLEFLLPNGL